MQLHDSGELARRGIEHARSVGIRLRPSGGWPFSVSELPTRGRDIDMTYSDNHGTVDYGPTKGRTWVGRLVATTGTVASPVPILVAVRTGRDVR